MDATLKLHESKEYLKRGRTYTYRMMGDGNLMTRQMSSNLMDRNRILSENDKIQTQKKKLVKAYVA
jgi:hypothetical protein